MRKARGGMRGFGIAVKFGCHGLRSVAMQSKAKLNHLLRTCQRRRLNSYAFTVSLFSNFTKSVVNITLSLE